MHSARPLICRARRTGQGAAPYVRFSFWHRHEKELLDGPHHPIAALWIAMRESAAFKGHKPNA